MDRLLLKQFLTEKVTVQSAFYFRHLCVVSIGCVSRIIYIYQFINMLLVAFILIGATAAQNAVPVQTIGALPVQTIGAQPILSRRNFSPQIVCYMFKPL